MPTRVLVGIKPDSDYASVIELAVDLVDDGATLHLASLVPVGNRQDEPERLEEARRSLTRDAERLRGDGFQAEIHVNLNDIAAGSELVRLASRYEAELIIIGLGKRSRVGKALLGSDAQTVLLSAHCPVVCSRIATY